MKNSKDLHIYPITVTWDYQKLPNMIQLHKQIFTFVSYFTKFCLIYNSFMFLTQNIYMEFQQNTA